MSAIVDFLERHSRCVSQIYYIEASTDVTFVLLIPHHTQFTVHSPLPTANYISGHYYSLVLPNFTYLFLSS